MLHDKITFMAWGFSEKQELMKAVEEAVKYFRKKHEKYTVKEIRVRTGMLPSNAKDNLYDGIPMSVDTTIFANNILYVVFN